MKNHGSLICGIFAVAALLMSGCASSDVSNDAKTTSEVIECLPTDAPPPTAIYKAVMFPKASGFGSVDTGQGRLPGVVVLAGKRLWFMVWDGDEHHFDVLRTIVIPDVAGLKIDRLGPASMLVIEAGNYSFDGFELLHGGQFGSDAAATQDLFGKLQALRPSGPPAGP